MLGPRRVTFVTNPGDCNLACGMCRDHGAAARRRRATPRTGPLAAEVVERVVAECAPAGLREVIASTRGEPLLWGGMERLARACATHGVALNVTTNGTFPSRGAAAWAELLVPVCRDVKISWNAATAATAAAVMPGLRLDRALDEVRAFLAVRDRHRAARSPACTVTFQVTAQEANVAELGEVVALGARLGVDRVKVNQLQVHFPELDHQDLRRDAASRARWSSAVAAMRASAARAGGAVRLEHVERWDRAPGAVASGPCPFLGYEAWVTAAGAFAPCPAPAVQDDASGRFGSVLDAPLLALWRGAGFRALVDAERQGRSACAACAFRRPGGA